MLAALGCLLLLLLSGHALQGQGKQHPPRRMTAPELMSLPVRNPDYQIPYGNDPNQYGELRVPSGAGPHPVVVLIHGGCWRSYAGARALGPMGDALKQGGIASWNIEYRRIPQPGSGWPGTYLDVGQAVDHLRAVASRYNLDPGRVAVLGHSAGAHLAMWIALRHRLREGPLFAANPLPIRGVLNLAGRVDMTEGIEEYEKGCEGEPVVKKLLGGTPAEVPERYRAVSANNYLPLGVPQVFIWGSEENFVPKVQVENYVRAAAQAKDRVRLITVPDTGHFETASPFSSAWPVVLSAIRSLLEGR